MVTITPTPPPPLSKKQKKRSGNIKKSSTTSFLPSPIQRALNTLHLLRCETRKPDRLKKTSSATTLGENFEIVATVEYERVFDTTGACVAILSGHCDQRNGGVYEFDPSQPEEVMEDDTNGMCDDNMYCVYSGRESVHIFDKCSYSDTITSLLPTSSIPLN